MKNIWEVWSAALTKAECDAIAARAARYPENDATVGFSDTQREDHGYRSSRIRWLDATREKDIVARIMDFVHQSNRNNFGVEIVAPFELQFTEYQASNNGHYDWHQDVWLESPRPYARKLSVVVQMSEPDEYTGGGFEFFGVESPGDRFMPRGSLLVFPSFLQHCVNPVASGTRRSLVTWIEGPNWR